MARTKSKSKDVANEIQVFEEFTTDEVKVISKYSEKKYYQRDEVVFQENSKDASLYVVLSGQLQVYAHTKDKKRVHLSDIEAGEVFGELSFLDNKPRSATILAFNDVSLLEVTREQFDMLRDNYPSIASKLILDLARVVSLRLRNADKFIVEISQIINNNKKDEELLAVEADLIKVKAEKKTEVKPTKVKAEKKTEVKPAKVKAEKKTEVKPAKVKAEKKTEVKPAKVKAEKKTEVKPAKVKAEKKTEVKPAKVKAEKKTEVKPAKVKAEKKTEVKPAKVKASKPKKSKIAYIAPKKPKKK